MTADSTADVRIARNEFGIRAKFGGSDGDWDEQDFDEYFEYVEGEDVRALAVAFARQTPGARILSQNVTANVPRPAGKNVHAVDSYRGKLARERLKYSSSS